jgi:ribonuclease E
VSSVALQLLRGLEEILMKGATHNLVVRTRTDVALYVLNHKRGHLRDLENSFKVTLSVIADPTVSAQQSFVIDRGEQVHTLEAAKALLAAQVAAFPAYVEEVYDEEEPFDVEVEAEVETDETEGLTEDSAAGEESNGETDADGHKRKRRRRRRGRPGEAREGAPARDENDVPRALPSAPPVAGAVAEEAESDEDESEDQPGVVRADQGPGGERRPRRRGRRGGRRRRGGPEDGLVGSIADELGPTPAPEATSAVADFDGVPAEQQEPSLPVIQPESIAPHSEPQAADHAQPEPVHVSAQHEETAQEAERAARRRSTVREKVSFLVDAQPAAAAPPVEHSQPEPAPPAPAPAQPTDEIATEDTQPRRAGWWSRRFGNGE